jgi:hypothetical protein
MPLLPRLAASRSRRSDLAQVPRPAHLRANTRPALRSNEPLRLEPLPFPLSPLGRHAAAVCAGVERSRSKSRDPPGHRQPLWRLCPQGKSLPRVCQQFGCRRCPPPTVLPNPSLERTSTGKSSWPRGALCLSSASRPRCLTSGVRSAQTLGLRRRRRVVTPL